MQVSCWCETNDKDKTTSISDAEGKITDLTATIEEATASSARNFTVFYVYFFLHELGKLDYKLRFFQVSRVRRGATQRDYRLLYYKFCRFAARKIWYGRI